MDRSPLPRPDGVPGAPLLSFLAGASVVRRRAFLAVGGFSARFLIGGEEELLAADLADAGWRMAYVPELEIHHEASKLRDADLRRRQGIRNTLWFAWLRRPVPSALRRSVAMLEAVPRDRTSLGALADVIRGVPYLVSQRRPVGGDVEAGLRLLDEDQLHSEARRYVS
jgi:N-acetylglucosaminyl-diphospho-decaprenol L-rhamnosyltransferase